MELIDQRTKKIMEECKERAKDAGLEIHGETLEYIVTNRDLLELSPKLMIPTLYDYWVHDVEVIRNKWVYDAYPRNPYETVINTRPAISFYNDNNPDWLNVMIFYHVLGHIDFFQNNIYFRKTWDDDFCGEALAHKRLLNRIREEMGSKKRWVDYVIEFARSIDNLVGYYQELEEADKDQMQSIFGVFSERANFYFGEFLKRLYDEKAVELKFYYDEVERYNLCLKQFGQKRGEDIFFDEYDFKSKFPEFNGVFKKSREKKKPKAKDILQYLMKNSEFINKEENKWMIDVLQVVRKTSLYFQPQFRDHIASEGWASLWHTRLFLADERIKGHEVNFAKVHSGVLMNPKVGFNAYAIGMLLFEFIEELASKGKLSYGFQLIKDSRARKHYDQNLGPEYGKKILFEARRNFNDFMLVNFLSDDDFQDFVDRHNLFVAGMRISQKKWGFVEIYIKSRSGKEYRKMLNKSLYHPPHVVINEEKAKEGELYLDHIFEGRTLVTKYIPHVLIGLAYLAGKKVKLETTEFEAEKVDYLRAFQNPDAPQPKYKKIRVLYTCEKKDVKRVVLSQEG
jgi:stage V sporulation protein R